MTPQHTPTPTPTPPPKARASPIESGRSAGPTGSSGSCESGPRQSPPSRAWSAGRQGLFLPDSSPAPCPEPGAYHRAPVGVRPLPMPGYKMPEPRFTLLSGLRGPESCGGRRRGSERSSNRSLTRSKIKEALCSATSEPLAGITQEIRDKLKPLITPHGSPVTISGSPNRVQANHVVAGLTHTLGGLRSQPTPASATVPRSHLPPTIAQPPYGNVENSIRAELDRLGLTALWLMSSPMAPVT